jgi:hypothetical protein
MREDASSIVWTSSFVSSTLAAPRFSSSRYDPRLLREQPRKRDLGRRGFLLRCDALDQIDGGDVRFPVVRREARDGVPEVLGVELRVLVDLPGEEALA